MGKLSTQINSEFDMLDMFDQINDDWTDDEIKEFESGLIEAQMGSLQAINGAFNFIDFMGSQIERQQKKKKRADSHIRQMERITEGIKWKSKNYLTKKGSKSIELDDWILSIYQTESVEIDSDYQTRIPDQYLRKTVKIDPDKTAIKKAIKSGVEVAGARLVKRDQLRIK